MPSHIVMIQGGPATGKSTLAQRLRSDVGIGVLSKDYLKEFLFDHIGLPVDRVESRLYGMATFNAQFAAAEVLVAGGKDFIFEGAFHTDIATIDIKRLSKVPGVQIMQIFCTVDPAIQTSRFNERIKDNMRHEGHNEAIRSEDGDFADTYHVLDIENTLTYDTTITDEAKYNEIAATVKKFLERDI